MKKIGITERGDIAFDNSWINKFNDLEYAILISKRLPDATGQIFINDVFLESLKEDYLKIKAIKTYSFEDK